MNGYIEMKESQQKVFNACLLAWLIPGGGHWYLGKKNTAIIIFAVITILYIAGLSLHGGVLWHSPDIISCISFVMRIGGGAMWLIGLIGPWRSPEILASFSEIGSAYTGIAGALNFLSIFAVFDIAKARPLQKWSG